MHYAHCVFIPGYVHDVGLEPTLETLMNHYYYDNDECISGEWDWWVVGGRWGGSWVLREGAQNGPLGTDPSSFGMAQCEKEGCNRIHTDCARLGNLEPESLHAPYSYIDLDGDWHTKWLGPEKSGSQDVKTWEVPDEDWSKQWLTLLQSYPDTTWMVLTDYHS